jgi:threonine synthase
MTRLEGIFAAPEGAAPVAIRRLVEQREIGARDSVVLFNTGSEHKYLEAWTSALAI